MNELGKKIDEILEKFRQKINEKKRAVREVDAQVLTDIEQAERIGFLLGLNFVEQVVLGNQEIGDNVTEESNPDADNAFGARTLAETRTYTLEEVQEMCRERDERILEQMGFGLNAKLKVDEECKTYLDAYCKLEKILSDMPLDFKGESK